MAFSIRANKWLFKQSALWRISRFGLATIVLFAGASGFAQQKSDFAGDYVGLYGGRKVYVHIKIGVDGSIGANIDSPATNLFNVPCSDVSINGPAFSFSVPSLRGEWTGLMSADQKSLAGVWKQGQPEALNFTRTTESVEGPPAPGRPPFPASAAAIAPSGSAKPPCTTILTPSYWDGSAWKPMAQAAHLGREKGISYKQALKNPFSYSSGVTSIVTFKDAAATLTVGPTPTFCIAIVPSTNPSAFMIGSIDVKNDHRELETCAGRCASKAGNSDDWMPQKRVQAIDIKRVSNTVVEITLKNPLPAGQYIIGGLPMVGYYDFGVTAGNAAQ